jgi:hypothetical protein
VTPAEAACSRIASTAASSQPIEGTGESGSSERIASSRCSPSLAAIQSITSRSVISPEASFGWKE